MSWTPVPLPSGSYADTARPWSQQEWVNWLPVKAERAGTRSDLIGRDVPGLRPFSVVGTGPIRGSHNAEGTLFVVSGTGLYRISPLGVASSLGTIPGVARVSMCHNQITGGNEVVIATGPSAYVYDTTAETLTQITDEGFPGAKSVRFLGQYIVGVEPFGRYWFHSDLADATSYNTINRYEAEGSPDLILHVEASQGEALVFGKRTIEVWSNVVTENASFQRTTVIERGAASGQAIVTLDNSCIFLGNDGILYRLNGYTPVPISTRAWENSIRGESLENAFAFTWEDAGHKVVYLTFPSGKSYGFDVAQGEMHRRESYGLNRWRLNTLTPFNRQWIGGDFADGTLWQVDWDYPGKEGCDEIVRICRTPVMHDGGNRVRVHAVRVFADTGMTNSVSLSASITGALPDGASGAVVSYQYTIEGYVEGDSVSDIAVTDGALPDGLSISSSGLVTGTRTTVGVYSFTISGTDRCGNTVSITDSSETTHSELTFIESLGPLLWWKLNETSGTTAIDYSGNNRPGTYAGNYTLDASGVHWDDDTGRVTRVVADGEIGVAGDASWCAMGVVTFDNIGAVYSFGRIAELRQTSSAGTNFSLYAYSPGGSSSALPRYFGSNVAGDILDDTTEITNGTRYLVALEVDTTTRTLYINGTAVASEAHSGNAVLGGELMLTGAVDGTSADSTRGFAGRSEHTLLFDYAIGAANHLELAQLFGLA